MQQTPIPGQTFGEHVTAWNSNDTELYATRQKSIGEYSNNIETAIAAIGSTPTTLIIDRPLDVLTANASIPSTLNIVWQQGVSLNLGGFTLTFNGSLDAGAYKLWSNGTVLGLNKAIAEWWGAVGDGVTDDYAAITAALASSDFVIGTPGKNYSIETKIEVHDKIFFGYGSTITITGDIDGIVLTGTTRPQFKGFAILSDLSQSAGKASLRMGNGATTTQCAHFAVDDLSFDVVGGSGRTEADAIKFDDDGSTGYAFIGSMDRMKVRNHNRGLFGIYSVNAISINQFSTHRCKNPWKIGDARSVYISNAEFGGNFARAIDFGDCFGVTLDTPYFEDNLANNGGHSLPTIKADIFVSGRISEGFRRDNPGSGITIINPTFGKVGAYSDTDYPVYVENGTNVKILGGHTVSTATTNFANGITFTDNSNNTGEIIDFVNDATGSGTTPIPSIGASALVKIGTSAIVNLTGINAYDVPSIPAGGDDSFTITVTGAIRGDFCIVSSGASIPAGITVSAIVGGVDTVRVVLTNTTAGAIDIILSSWRAIVFPKDGYFA